MRIIITACMYIYIYREREIYARESRPCGSRLSMPTVSSPARDSREFTKGGLVEGGLAICALLSYHYC